MPRVSAWRTFDKELDIYRKCMIVSSIISSKVINLIVVVEPADRQMVIEQPSGPTVVNYR